MYVAYIHIGLDIEIVKLIVAIPTGTSASRSTDEIMFSFYVKVFVLRHGMQFVDMCCQMDDEDRRFRQSQP